MSNHGNTKQICNLSLYIKVATFIFLPFLYFKSKLKHKQNSIAALKLLKKKFLLSNVCCRVMVFDAIFNNISVISWPSVLLVEEI